MFASFFAMFASIVRNVRIIRSQPASFNAQPQTKPSFARHLDVINDEESDPESSFDAAADVRRVEPVDSVADTISDTSPSSTWAQPAAASDGARRRYSIANRSAAVGGSAPPEPRRRISVMERGENPEDIQRMMLEDWRKERERASAVKANERERAEEKLRQKLEQRRQNYVIEIGSSSSSSGGGGHTKHSHSNAGDIRVDDVNDDGW
jgi:hypothetical protein